MTAIYSYLATRDIDNERFVMLTKPFIFKSDVLQNAGLPSRVEVPKGFVFDLESIPLFRGSNSRAGTAHDYLSRSDSVPIVTKRIAADVYLEMMDYTYDITDKTLFKRFTAFLRRWIKWGAVNIAPGYFHKYGVAATCLEISGIEDDPFVTQEKLDAVIKDVEQVSEDLKQIDIPEVPSLVEKADKLAEDLVKASPD